MRRRRSPYLAFAALTAAGVAIGVLWIQVQPASLKQNAQVRRELADLQTAEQARRPKSAAADSPALCKRLDVVKRGTVTDNNLDEISGLVLSRRTKGLFWAIEDSGAEPVLTALRENGSLVGNWTVAGAENFDWEDVAAGPSPDGPVLYAADIGDNLRQRESVTIYRVPEPASPVGGGTTAPAAKLVLRYPDGAHDAESLLVDPRRGTLLIITKGLSGNVYALSKPLPFGGSATLRKVGPAALAYATAADVSADGTTVALRGYFSLVEWARRGNEPLTTTLKRQPCTSPTGFDDGQGEAFTLSSDGRTAWSVAEGRRPPVYRYRARGDS